MKKILNNKFLIILIILTIVKLILCTLLPSYTIKSMSIDDDLMFELAKNIYNGDWLGEYNNLTLIKGMFYPLLLALFHIMHIPVNFGLSLIYISACIFFCYVTKDIFKNKKYIYIVYLLLLFNPISFASETFERLYRNSLGPAQILFILGFLYGIYKHRNSFKKMLPHLIGLGLSFSSVILTREDYIWVLPAIILIYILFIIKEKSKNILGLLIPIIIIITSLNIVSLINKHYYNTTMINEMNESSYKKAYLEILKIKPKEDIYKVSIPASSLEIAIKNSTTLRDIKPNLLGAHDSLKYIKKNQFIDGDMIWHIRTAAAIKGYYKNPQKAEKFWNDVYKELKEARESGKYETRLVVPSIFVSPPTKANITNFIKELPHAFTYIFTYKNVQTYSYEELEKFKYTSIYEKPDEFYKNYNRIVVTNIPKADSLVEPTYKGVAGIFNIITFIYKDFSIIINILGIISFIYLIIKKQYKKLLMPLLLIISFITLVLGVTYTHVSAFEAIRYFYLGPAYILLITFSIISILILIEGVQNEEINNINAMFKRSRKPRIMHRKSPNISKNK